MTAQLLALQAVKAHFDKELERRRLSKPERAVRRLVLAAVRARGAR